MVTMQGPGSNAWKDAMVIHDCNSECSTLANTKPEAGIDGSKQPLLDRPSVSDYKGSDSHLAF